MKQSMQNTLGNWKIFCVHVLKELIFFKSPCYAKWVTDSLQSLTKFCRHWTSHPPHPWELYIFCIYSFSLFFYCTEVWTHLSQNPNPYYFVIVVWINQVTTIMKNRLLLKLKYNCHIFKNSIMCSLAKEVEIRISKIYLHSHVNCSTIHNTQCVEITSMSTNRWRGEDVL
jgi:hypothetical protein